MDKVFCPYCGSEMELEHLGSDDCEAFLYACHKCGASSPMKSSNDEALQAALARPLQKPLTLEEAKKELALWIEYPPNIYYHRACLYPVLYSADFRAESTYGIGWRCWATKPTDEEREAAKWDE